MTPEHRDHLRALAQRVRTEEPTEALRDAVLIAFGWTHHYRDMWITTSRDLAPSPIPNPLTSIDAAAALMPEGWSLIVRIQDDGWASASASKGDLVIREGAPTEPRARCAAALEAMANIGPSCKTVTKQMRK